MPNALRRFVRPVFFVVLVLAAYGLLRSKRTELVDFVVPRTAAIRFINSEPLYRPDDGHYQYKYLPAFALGMVPFTWLPKEAAQFTWFTLTFVMTGALVALSVRALPERRIQRQLLVWLTLLVTGKFLVKELAFGQFNLPVALLLLTAGIAAQRHKPYSAGALVAAAIFVKPYALVLVPWLLLTLGWRPFIPFAAVVAVGLVLPVTFYGWSGNLTLLQEWYRTVTQTTAPNLMLFENISFASMWAKWIEPGSLAARMALISAAVATAAGLAIIMRRRGVKEPDYLEVGYFCLLVPLVSPQGWDYVLITALPAYVCLVDRWRELSPNWRALALGGLFLTSFTIFDLLGRALYTHLMQIAAVSVGAVLIALCLGRLRTQGLA